MSDKLYHWRGSSLYEADDKYYYQAVYSEAEDQVYQIGDCVSMLPEDGKLSYIGRIVALYEQLDGAKFVQTTWFYRPEETLLGRQATDGDRELFFSDEKAENSVTSVLNLCFVVTLSQFKRGVTYLRQTNPLVEEKNLFFAHKKYDRVAQLLHYLPMYKALGQPVQQAQVGWQVDKILATMRSQKTDTERLFVRWKDRDPIYCSWIERDGQASGAQRKHVPGRLFGYGMGDNSSIVEEKEINVHDNASFDSSEIPDCVEMNIDQPLIVNYGESSDDFQSHFESSLLRSTSNNSNDNINHNSNDDNGSKANSSSLNSNFSPLNRNNANNNSSNAMEIIFPQSLIPKHKPPIASSPNNITNSALDATQDQQKRKTEAKDDGEHTSDLNASEGNGSPLYLPITIKIATGQHHRSRGLSASSLSVSRKRSTSGGDRWDISNMVGLSTSGNHFVPQQRPYDDVNIPQWHVMTEDEENEIPEGEGSSEEDTDDSAYEEWHEEANVRLKEMVAEMLKVQQEQLKLKKQKSEHIMAQRDREVGSMDERADNK